MWNEPSDGRVLALIGAFLKAEILDGLRHWTPESGAPQEPGEVPGRDPGENATDRGP